MAFDENGNLETGKTKCDKIWGMIAWDVKRKKRVSNGRCGRFLGIFHKICFSIDVLLIVLVVYYPGKKGWTVEYGLHTTTFKITGTAKDNGKPPRVWEAADLMDPPEQTNAFFLTTKMERVPNQRFSPSCPTIRTCNGDEDCKSIGLNHARGRQHDGECKRGFCEVPGTWCPLPDERDETSFDVRSIHDLSKINVVIRNTVFFPDATKNITNVNDDVNALKCSYDKSSDTHKWCPVFSIERILNQAGVIGSNEIRDLTLEGIHTILSILELCSVFVNLKLLRSQLSARSCYFGSPGLTGSC